PGGGDDGLFARDGEGRVLAWDRRANREADAGEAEIAPALVGEATLPDGRTAVPVFQLMAERYMDSQYAPEAVAARCGIDAGTIRRLAAELARTAFDEAITVDQPWTDWAGRRHATMVGRPVAMHAMRGISAHSNGFHTCRAIHLLQMLLGAIDTPGSFRFEAPFPKPCPPGPKPAGRDAAPLTPLGGIPLGNPTGPEDLMLAADGTPLRIDKAYSWEAPIAAHGLMHTVIRNAAAGDPYPIDTLFMYMANMAWNSSMDTGGAMRLLAEKGADGGYRIPRIIYADAFYSETVAYADLVLPDTTYLERWDCISLLDRPISSPEGPADAIRQPVLAPDRDVRPFQDVLIELGARLKLPGFVTAAGEPRYKDYADYIVNHERKPGIGPLAGWRGADGESHGTGAPNPKQLERYIANGCFWRLHLPPEQLYYKHANKDYLENARRLGFLDKAAPIVMQIYSEPLQRFRLAARGHGAVQPPEQHRRRVETYFDPLPIWYVPFEEAAVVESAYPMHAVTQRPMPMYHSWHSQNAWLRQVLSHNRLYMNRQSAAALGLAEDDWVWVVSHHGRVKGQLRLMEGVNPHTVWTWNAVGKRAGAWNLASDAPEARKGFLLNHVISDLLPPRGDGARYGNCDPVTGQAAWYDLRVRVEKAAPAEAGESLPSFAALKRAPGLAAPPRVLRYGAGGRR